MFSNLSEAIGQKWTGIYLRFLAVCFLYGVINHITNLLGIGNINITETPKLWHILDVVLLSFDSVLVVGLWYKKVWATVMAILVIICLQIIPYTLFRNYFILRPEDAITINGLVITEIILLGILGILIIIKK